MIPIDIPQSSGIYRITCIPTEKIYIGSSINLRVRCLAHLRALQHNVHDNAYLQRAWNKYGRDAFTFEVVEYVLPIALTAREQYWFNKLSPFGKNGFNLAPIAGSTLPCEETLQKMSKSQLGRVHKLETRRKISLAHIGNKHSEESIAKMRKSHIGNTYNIGRKHTPESRSNMNAAHIGEMKTIILTAPDGTEHAITGIKRFCRDHDLHSSAIIRVAKGKQDNHKGWKARYPEANAS